MITVPMGKLQKNTNLVYDALETSRLEESVYKPNENDGIIHGRAHQDDQAVRQRGPGPA